MLFVDNFDSFTYNLVEYVSEHAETKSSGTRHRSTMSRRSTPTRLSYRRARAIRRTNAMSGSRRTSSVRSTDVPTLGVCLGLEAAVYAYGGTIGHAPEPIHGKAFPVDHDGAGVFAGLEDGFPAGRYHSLVATDVPDGFDVWRRPTTTARRW